MKGILFSGLIGEQTIRADLGPQPNGCDLKKIDINYKDALSVASLTLDRPTATAAPSAQAAPRTANLSYCDAICEALDQAMAADARVVALGIGVDSPWYVGNTTRGLFKKYGPDRVMDPPVSEAGFTGMAIGAAISGLRPVVIHPRMDFMYYAFDQIVNNAAAWSMMFGPGFPVPIVLRGIVNRGGEQGAQHSQSLHSVFLHIPGIKVVMPATPKDAKGLMLAAIADDGPVLYIDDRWNYGTSEAVPTEMYTTPIGVARVAREGKDLTIVASSYLVHESLRAADRLKARGIDAEVIDLRTIKPLDADAIVRSVHKTGRLLVVDGSWACGGVAAEVAAIVQERAFDRLHAPVARLTLPDSHTPASPRREKEYFIDSAKIEKLAHSLAQRKPS